MIKRILISAAIAALGFSALSAIPAHATEVHGTRIIPPGEWRRTEGNQYVVRADDFGSALELESDGEHSFSVLHGKSWSAWSAYPYIGRGCSWGVCAAPGGGDWPVQVGRAGDGNPYASLSTTQTYRGSYNTALDIWFSTYAQTDGADNGTEMMIWANHPGISINDSAVTHWNVYLDGQYWDVYQWRTSTDGVGRNYIAFIAAHQSSSFYGHLNPFFWKAESYGVLKSDWYWTSIDAGFELDGGGSGEGLGINHFAVNS
jgi:glycosyl hydrolase family 12